MVPQDQLPEAQRQPSQRLHFAQAWTQLPLEPISFPDDLRAWINFYPLYALREFFHTCQYDSFLTVCDGRGLEAQFLRQQGVHTVVASDLEPAHLAALKRAGVLTSVLAADAEQLPFPPAAFDWALVRNGLHHLSRPLLGFYELLRVARKGIIIMEAQDSILVRLLVRLGLAEDYEEAGNYVYRFTLNELHKISRSLSLPCSASFTMCVQYIATFDSFLERTSQHRLVHSLIKRLILLGNLLMSGYGNSLNFICFCREPSPELVRSLRTVPHLRIHDYSRNLFGHRRYG